MMIMENELVPHSQETLFLAPDVVTLDVSQKRLLQAAWNTIPRLNEKIKIYTLKFDRLVLAKTEVITITYAVEIARAATNAINRKKLCSRLKVLKSDFYIPRVFGCVSMKFIKRKEFF